MMAAMFSDGRSTFGSGPPFALHACIDRLLEDQGGEFAALIDGERWSAAKNAAHVSCDLLGGELAP